MFLAHGDYGNETKLVSGDKFYSLAKQYLAFKLSKRAFLLTITIKHYFQIKGTKLNVQQTKKKVVRHSLAVLGFRKASSPVSSSLEKQKTETEV